MIMASMCFLGNPGRMMSALRMHSASSYVVRRASSSLSSSSYGSKSYTVETENANSVTDAMSKAATSEAERLFRYYNNTNNKQLQQSSIITKPPTVWRSRTEVANYIRENIDTVLFDCDGVLYRTTSLCPGASECIRGLINNNKTVLFVTNNAGVNRRELREKLSTLLQIDSLTIDQMISSSYSSAQYLKQQLIDVDDVDNNKKSSSSLDAVDNKRRPRVHVIGSSGLCEELVAVGFDVTTGDDNNETTGSMSREELADYDFNQLHPIDALVVGHDTDLNFRKLCIADNLLLRNPNALFVATNKDSFDLVDGQNDRRHIVGNGCTVVALEYSSKRSSINVGKPSKELFELIRRKYDDNHDDDNNHDDDDHDDNHDDDDDNDHDGDDDHDDDDVFKGC
jgi:4-nitrophenyl phosphatase